MKDYDARSREIRKKVLDMVVQHGDSHLGGEFSEIEILAALYDEVLKPEDKFILSKGHACHPLYVLLRERGYNPTIAGHPDIDESNGISCTTGSLGHGLPIGVGMALARKKLATSGRIYVLMSDGECQEGTTWESSLIATHHQLDNLVAIIDHNKLQALDRIDRILSLGNLGKKFESFGWDVSEIDGHNYEEIIPALRYRKEGYPRMIIAHTIKGKGVSYMEGDPKWHARYPKGGELARAYRELGGKSS